MPRPLFVLDRDFPAPPGFAASWLHGEGSGLAWTTRIGPFRVEHALREAPGGSIMRFAVHGAPAWRLVAPALRLVIVLRSRRMSRRMRRDFEAPRL